MKYVTLTFQQDLPTLTFQQQRMMTQTRYGLTEASEMKRKWNQDLPASERVVEDLKFAILNSHWKTMPLSLSKYFFIQSKTERV